MAAWRGNKGRCGGVRGGVRVFWDAFCAGVCGKNAVPAQNFMRASSAERGNGGEGEKCAAKGVRCVWGKACKNQCVCVQNSPMNEP